MENEPETPWLKITVKTTPQAAESLTEFLMEVGGLGGVETVSLAGNPEENEGVALITYWKRDSKLKAREEQVLGFLQKLKNQGVETGEGAILIEPFIDRGWERRWKFFFKPLRVGRLVIKPTWRRFKLKPEDILIHIDPGMAFGTGGHATTVGCLTAVEELISGNERVLDLGTGSGILSLAAVKLGAKEVLALDIDPEACEVARENIIKNNVLEGITVELGGIEKARGPFDLVLANIHTEILLGLLPEFKGLLAPQGHLILSGILESQGPMMMEEIKRHGFCLQKITALEGWVTLWLGL